MTCRLLSCVPSCPEKHSHTVLKYTPAFMRLSAVFLSLLLPLLLPTWKGPISYSLSISITLNLAAEEQQKEQREHGNTQLLADDRCQPCCTTMRDTACYIVPLKGSMEANTAIHAHVLQSPSHA